VLHDKLTITGIRPGAPNAGSASVTFELYDNGSCTDDPDNGLNLIGREVDNTILAGVAETTDGLEVTETGFYYWKAIYSGDQYNAGFSTECGAEVTQIQAKDNLVVDEPTGEERDDLMIPSQE
jgi:hypothetical protein